MRNPSPLVGHLEYYRPPFDRRGATYQESGLFEGLRLARVPARANAESLKQCLTYSRIIDWSVTV